MTKELMTQHGDLAVSMVFGYVLSVAGHFYSFFLVNVATPAEQIKTQLLGTGLSLVLGFLLKKLMGYLWSKARAYSARRQAKKLQPRPGPANR